MPSFFPMHNMISHMSKKNCHMRNSVSYLILRCILSYTNDQQFHHQRHLMIVGVQVHLLISWHEYVQSCYEVYASCLQVDYSVHK